MLKRCEFYGSKLSLKVTNFRNVFKRVFFNLFIVSALECSFMCVTKTDPLMGRYFVHKNIKRQLEKRIVRASDETGK